METATSIMPWTAGIDILSSNVVKRAVDTHYTGDVRVMNSNPLGGYQLKSLVSMLDNLDDRNRNDLYCDKNNKYGVCQSLDHIRLVLNEDENGQVILTTHDLETGTSENTTMWQEGGASNAADYFISCIGFNGANDVLFRDGGRNWKYIQHKQLKHVEQRRIAPINMQRVHLNQVSKFPKMKPWYESSDIEGLYFAGAQMHGRDYKRGNNGFIHGFRYSIRALHRWLEQEAEDVSWPVKWGSDEPWELTGRMHHRIRTTSGLYQMFGVMCDVWIYSEGGHLSNGRFREPTGVAHLQEVPCDMVPHLIERNWRYTYKNAQKKEKQRNRVRFFTVNLDYARCYKDEAVILQTRFCAINNFGCYSQTNFLHPIIRYYDSPAHEDLRKRTKKEFEYGANRELHLAEDLGTKWQDIFPFWLTTRLFFERIDMLRRGMSKEAAPILLMERDTSVPITNCELYKLGEFFFNKAQKYFKQIDEIQERKKKLFSIPRKERMQQRDMLNKKERDHSVMLEYFLAQALKMKPLLWKKVWRGFQIRLNADKQGQSNKKEDPYKIHDIYTNAEQLFVSSLSQHSGKSAMTCATPTMSVRGCLSKWVKSQEQVDELTNVTVPMDVATTTDVANPRNVVTPNPRDSWFHDAVFTANASNSREHGGARTPCFARYSCKRCMSARCAWCFSSNICVAKDYGTCPKNHTTKLYSCKKTEENGESREEEHLYAHFWRDVYPNKIQSHNAMLTRIEIHPSNHAESIEFTNQAREDAVVAVQTRKSTLCDATGSSSCSQCIQDTRCAWCQSTNQCVFDAQGMCPGNLSNHIGRMSGTFPCPEVKNIIEHMASNTTYALSPQYWKGNLVDQNMRNFIEDTIATTAPTSKNMDAIEISDQQQKFERNINQIKMKRQAREEAETSAIDTKSAVNMAHTKARNIHLHMNTTEHFDYVIVGAGPGGLQMARFLQEKNRSYIVLEKNSSVGSSFMTYPKHRKLISTNKIYAGNTGREFHMRHDWNSLLHTVQDLDDVPPAPIQFQNYSTDYFPHADALVNYLKDFKSHYEINVRYNSEVLGLFQPEQEDDDDDTSANPLFFVNVRTDTTTTTDSNWIRCNRVVWATGYIPHNLFDKYEAPEGRIIKYADLDINTLAQFTNKQVHIIGKGNSAMEVADSIMPYVATLDMFSRNIPKRAVETHYTGDIREMNEAAIGGYQLKSLVSLIDGRSNKYDKDRNQAEKSLNSEKTETTLRVKYESPFRDIGMTGSIDTDSVTTTTTNKRFNRSSSQVDDGVTSQDNSKQTDSKNKVYGMDYIIQCTGFDSNLTVFSSLDKSHGERKVQITVLEQGSNDLYLKRVVLPKTGDDTKDKFPDLKPWYESKQVEGLYFAGAQMHGRDYKRGNNGFIHGFRYSIRVLHRWMEQEIEQNPWPIKWTGSEPWELTGLVHKRILSTSGLYQMFGVMCDLFVFSEGHDTLNGRHSDPTGVAYMQEMPCDMIPHVIERTWRHKSASGKKQRVRFFTLVLDYDRCYKDVAVFSPTRLCRMQNPGCFSQSNFLHPIIRYYDSPGTEDLRKRSAIDFEHKPNREFHLVEDLDTKWDGAKLTDATRIFFERMTLVRMGINGMGIDGRRVPLLLTERDTLLPLPDCEMEQIGELFLSKAAKMYHKYGDTLLVDVEKGTTEDLEAIAMYTFFVAQALKFKPNLYRKIYSARAMELESLRLKNITLERTRSLSLQDLLYATAKQILDATHLKRKLQKRRLTKALQLEINSSPTVCTTPGFSVSGCLQKRFDIIGSVQDRSEAWNQPKPWNIPNNGISNPFKWLEAQALKPNVTNVLSQKDRSPCFVFFSCNECASINGCSWCPSTQFCVQKGLCPANENPLLRAVHDKGKHVAAACLSVENVVNEAKQIQVEREVNTLGDLLSFDVNSKRGYLKYLPGQMQQNMAFENRLVQHPSNHSESLLDSTMYRDSLNASGLWQSMTILGNDITEIQRVRVGQQYLADQERKREKRLSKKQQRISTGVTVECKEITSCQICIQQAHCAYCLGEEKCVADVKGNCGSETDHIGSLGSAKSGCPVVNNNILNNNMKVLTTEL